MAEQNKNGTKFDQGKAPHHLLSPVALEELSQVLAFGAQKYGEHNWRKGIKISRLVSALLRHVFSFLGGQDKDEETGLSHIAHAMACCMFIIETMKTNKAMDDRYREVPSTVHNISGADLTAEYKYTIREE